MTKEVNEDIQMSSPMRRLGEWDVIKPSQECILCGATQHRVLQRGRDGAVLRCSICKLIFVRPLPTTSAHMSFHDERYFRSFYETGIEEFHSQSGPLFQLERRVKSNRLKLIESFRGGGRLLDVGTGQGLFPILAEESGWESWATDVSEYVCAHLVKRGIRALRGYVEDLRLPTDYFDVITLWHCLEHAFNPLTTLQTLFGALRAGGTIFIEVPRISTTEIRLRRLLRRPAFAFSLDEWHFYHFTPATLSRLVSQAGFDIVLVGHQPLLRKTLRGRIVENMRNLISSVRFIDLRSTIFLVAKKGLLADVAGSALRAPLLESTRR